MSKTNRKNGYPVHRRKVLIVKLLSLAVCASVLTMTLPRVSIAANQLTSLAKHSEFSYRHLPGGVANYRTKTDYLLFETRSPNKFWHIKSVAVPGARVVFHGVDRYRVKFQFDNTSGCTAGVLLSVGDVMAEGPEVDDFVDAANPWKNAFVRPLSLTKPPTFPILNPD